jgi:hypothetical protein
MPVSASTRVTPGRLASAVAYDVTAAARSAGAASPVATTEMAPASSVLNSLRITSCTSRDGDPGGSTRSSGSPSSMCRNGLPRNSSTTITLMAIGTGRFITVTAMRCQKPSVLGVVERFHSVHVLMRWPRAASMAGSTTMA